MNGEKKDKKQETITRPLSFIRLPKAFAYMVTDWENDHNQTYAPSKARSLPSVTHVKMVDGRQQVCTYGGAPQAVPICPGRDACARPVRQGSGCGSR